MHNFLEFINEKWVNDMFRFGTYYPIYENPTTKDLVELRKAGLVKDSVRFAAISDKKRIYVWSGMNIIHFAVLDDLAKKKVLPWINHYNIDQAFCGECKLVSRHAYIR